MTPIAFNYMNEVHVSSVSPQSGPSMRSTEVSVYGSNFANSGEAVCGWFSQAVDGDSVFTATKATYVSSYVMKCPTPALLAPVLSTQVELSLNGGTDFTSTKTQFYFHSEVTVTALVPPSGPETGGTIVTVVGSNFLPFDGLACRFSMGSQIYSSSSAVFLASDAITCTTPALPPGDYTVSVSNNGFNFGMDYPSFSSQSTITTSALTPSTGACTGGTTVIISGGSIPDSPSLSCKFGDRVERATRVSDSEMTCESPPAYTTAVSTSVDIFVSGNGRDFIATGFVYTYVPIPSVTQLYPVSGPVGGGTLVTFSGNNLDGGSLSTQCRFGSDIVDATVISSNLVQCFSPASSVQSSVVGVDISTNGGADWSKSGLAYLYQEMPVLTSISPPAGIETGGNKVIIIGTGFSKSASLGCKFGSTTVTGTLISSDRIECVAPPTSVAVGSAVGVAVTLNGYDFSPVEMTYTYTQNLQISSVTPSSSSVGGTAVVTVTGENFAIAAGVAGLNLHCRFGDLQSMATVVSDTELHCEAPPAASAGSYVFDVFANGYSGVASDAKSVFSTFSYFTPSTVNSISPAFGSSLGGTKLLLQGDNFDVENDMYCHFEGNVAGATLSESVLAVVSSANELTCVTPAVSLGSTPVVYAEFTLRNAAGSVVSGLLRSTFSFRRPLVLTSISPTVGNLEGGTEVTFTVDSSSSFVNSSSLSCIWDGVTSSGVFISSTQAKCTSPIDPGRDIKDVVVGISNNNADYDTSTTATFSFAPPPQIDKLSVLSGPTTGGTHVTVTGTNFASLLFCEFEVSGENSVVVRADSVMSETSAICITPQLVQGTAVVKIGSNAAEFLGSGASFEVYIAPSVSSLSHNSGIHGSFTTVTVSGENFAGNAFCAIKTSAGEIVSQAIASDVTSTSIACDLACPASNANIMYSVEVSINGGVDWTGNNLPFYCEDSPIITFVYPSFVEVGMGAPTTVTISGDNFSDRPQLACKLEDTTTGSTSVASATYVGAHTIWCAIPPMETPGDMKLSVTNDGVHYCEEPVSITHHPMVSITSVSPSTVAVGGVVTLSGTNFQKDAATSGNVACMIAGVTATEVDILSDTEMRCTTAQDTTTGFLSAAEVSVTFNGVDFSTSLLSLTILPPPSVTSISPTSGLLAGGTNVVVVGKNFVEGAGLMCMFGDVSTYATYISSTTLSCISPPSLSSSAVGVTVSTDEFVSPKVRSDAAFRYFEAAVVTSLAPTSGSMLGGTTLMIYGTGFDSTLNYVCSFATVDGPLTAAGVWVSPKAVSCITPSVLSAARNVEVELLDLQFGVVSTPLSKLTYSYFSQPAIHSISPALGPVNGGVEVTITKQSRR